MNAPPPANDGAPVEPGLDVLMSTYASEKPEHLDASLASLWAQTLLPARVVLVVDGPVPEAQETVIADYAGRPGPVLDVVRLDRNVGLAAAMNAGLHACKGTWVARMDSDDLCEPDRFAVQVAYAKAHPEVDVVSSWSEEFYEDGSPSQVKVSSVGHSAVVRALRWRNVLVHPTVMVRTALLRRVGGYRREFGLMEDYDLFVRLAQAGATFHVIPKALLRVRSSVAQKQRRGGWAYCRSEIRFRAALLRSGFIRPAQFVLVTALYLVFRLLSGRVKRGLYRLARS